MGSCPVSWYVDNSDSPSAVMSGDDSVAQLSLGTLLSGALLVPLFSA